MIRQGLISDVPRVLALIRELAEYEKAAGEVTNTIERMEKDGFGENPLFGFFVAEADSLIVGLALYYYRYSTWKGKRLYLEDIIVTESHRGKGVGKALFEQTMRKAVEDNCSGMAWQVLDWNEPALNFYRKFGCKLDNGWINCGLEIAELKLLVGG